MCPVFDIFIANWCLVCYVPHVWSRCLLLVSKSRPSYACSSIYFAFFPPFLFFPFFTSLFPSSWRFNCSGASFFLDPPSFPSHSLVSLSYFFLCFCSLMVEFSMVRSDFPSISIFFVHLCSLLEAVGRWCSKVEGFVGRNCPFRFALCSLFPLVHHFVGFALGYVRRGWG